MIIGLNGRLKSGKDTTYQIIKQFVPNAEQISYAKKLKESAAASIGMTLEQVEELKNDEEAVLMVYDSAGNAIHSFTMRQYLQWYGTEGHRKVFGDNFWVDQALPVDTDHTDRLLVVTDMRFPDEAQRVLDLGGATARVLREAETKHSDHASEQDIDYLIQYTLDNTGDLDHLERNVRDLLTHLQIIPDKFVWDAGDLRIIAHSNGAARTGGF
jgi:hypothetical protein